MESKPGRAIVGNWKRYFPSEIFASLPLSHVLSTIKSVLDKKVCACSTSLVGRLTTIGRRLLKLIIPFASLDATIDKVLLSASTVYFPFFCSQLTEQNLFIQYFEFDCIVKDTLRFMIEKINAARRNTRDLIVLTRASNEDSISSSILSTQGNKKGLTLNWL